MAHNEFHRSNQCVRRSSTPLTGDRTSWTHYDLREKMLKRTSDALRRIVRRCIPTKLGFVPDAVPRPVNAPRGESRILVAGQSFNSPSTQEGGV